MEPEQTKTGGWKKIATWIGVVIAIVVVVGYNGENIVRWLDAREAQQYDATLAANKEKLKAMEMADTYGSTTPEGTIELIITALEKNDIELAAKYYYVLDQEKAKTIYKPDLDSKKIIEYWQRLLGGVKSCTPAEAVCVFENEVISDEDKFETLPGSKEQILIPKGSKEIESKTLGLNKFTGVWKIRF